MNEICMGSCLVTHKDCLDGSGCAAICMAVGIQREDVYFIVPGTAKRFFEKGDGKRLMESSKQIVVADICCDDKDLLDAFEKRGNVLLLDHHLYSNSLSGRSWCHVRTDLCATEIVRRATLPIGEGWWHVSELIMDRDLWENRFGLESEDLFYLSELMGQEAFVGELMRMGVTFGVMSTEKRNAARMMSDYVKRQIEHDLTKSTWITYDTVGVMTMGPYEFAVVFSSCPDRSRMLEELKRREPDCDVFVQIDIGRRSVSMRSDTVDVAELARNFRGGGHARAAGFMIREEQVDSVVEDIILR